MKKLMALLLSMVMVLSLAACGGAATSSAAPAESTKTEEETTAPSSAPAAVADSAEEGSANEGNATVAETVGDPFEAMAEDYISYPLEGDNTISMWYYIPGYQDFMDSNYSFNALKTAEAATGVKLEFTEVSDQSARELFNVMVAGGDYPDLLPVMEYYTGGLSKAYEDGVIVDINDYMDDNMPNYLAVRDCLDEKTVKATLTEGMTLAFYQIKDGTYSGNGLVSRADWIKAQGVEFSGDVIGLDEFTDYLRTKMCIRDSRKRARIRRFLQSCRQCQPRWKQQPGSMQRKRKQPNRRSPQRRRQSLQQTAWQPVLFS